MEILVLLKQVPATESVITVADDGRSIRSDGLSYVINPYDELAVEEALKVREAHGGTVTVLSIGSSKTVEAIRTAMAMGADKGVLIDPDNLALDGLGTAKILAETIRTLSYDLILAGHRAVDSDNYQIGPAVAELLDIPNISMAISAEFEGDQIRCQCTVESGTKEVQAPLPALVTTQRGLNEPRYASLPGVMKAKKKPLETKTLADLGLKPDDLHSLTQIKALVLPPERKAGRMVDGDSVQVKVDKLMRLLHEEAKVI